MKIKYIYPEVTVGRIYEESLLCVSGDGTNEDFSQNTDINDDFNWS